MSDDVIELDDVGFRIGLFELSGISLRVSKGEYFCLTGPNGAGKSVLLKLIAGLFAPDHGSVRICGKDVTGAAPWTRNIGYMPQDGLLFPWLTAAQNIRFGLEMRRWGEDAICVAVNDIAKRLGIIHLLDRKPSGLSGGERQKISLARALVLNPPVLLLDEPVSAIDESTRDKLCRDLGSLQREFHISVIHVSHHGQEIDLIADRVGRLEGGRWRNTVTAECHNPSAPCRNTATANPHIPPVPPPPAARSAGACSCPAAD